MLSWLDLPTVKILLPIGTFVLGFFASRLTMTKKERADVEQKKYENGMTLMAAQLASFRQFAKAIKKYKEKGAAVAFDDFYEISTVGENYFYQQRMVSDAILSDKVDRRSRDNTLVPSVVETVNKSLPAYYDVLQSIARRRGFEYTGTLKRENYESLYLVVEKYGKIG